MRILNNNVLNATNTIFSSSADNDNIENIFDNDIDFVGKFENINYGEITSKAIDDEKNAYLKANIVTFYPYNFSKESY